MRPNTVDWLANLTDSITRRCSSEAQRGGGGAAGAATTAGAPPPLMTLAELQARVRQVKADALGGSAQWQLMLQASGGQRRAMHGWSA